jgi:hypothetical protein
LHDNLFRGFICPKVASIGGYVFRLSRIFFVIAVSISVTSLEAATSGIGIAMSGGSILLNNSRTAGNATIFDGTTLETLGGWSQVRLKDGAQVRFGADSSGRLFSDHVELLKGSARIYGYAANAKGLNVQAEGDASATVSMQGAVVEVASLTGNIQIYNAAGVNVANLLPGRALSLSPQEAGAAAPSSLVGCAESSGNNIILTDETSNVTVQLRGGNVRTGRRIQVTGTMVPNTTPAAPATQVINVTGVKNVGGVCKAGVAAVAPGAGGAATGAAGGAAAAGASIASAVIGGIGAAAAIGTAAGIAATSGTPSSATLGGSGVIIPASGSSAALGSRF